MLTELQNLFRFYQLSTNVLFHFQRITKNLTQHLVAMCLSLPLSSSFPFLLPSFFLHFHTRPVLFSLPQTGVNQFSNEPQFFLSENGIYKTKFKCQIQLTITGVLQFLGPLSGQSQEIHICILTHLCTHVYFCFCPSATVFKLNKSSY